MIRPRIWAPDRDGLVVVVDGDRIPASPDPERSGWFLGPQVPEGADYWIELDGRLVPDPLARWLPDGVDGPSRAFDARALEWSDAQWPGAELSTASVIYELHVGTFTPDGTLDAAVAHLPHLVRLGVTHIELMPLAAFDGVHGWGYDGVCLNAVHSAYGGPVALGRFVDAAHAAGLAVLLDVVYNHLGPSGSRLPSFGPFLTDQHRTPWGDAVNLDGPGSDDVRTIIVESALGWLRDFHLDGLRLDAVHALRDDRARHLLEELADHVAALGEELGRPLTLIAESDRNDPRTVEPTLAGGRGMTAQWDDDVHHALHWILTGEAHGYYADFASCGAAATAIARGFLHDGRWSSFRGRSHGRPIDFLVTPPSRFVVSLQTHDQVGNRAAGERLSHLVDADRLAAGAMLLLALPYVPMVFMGEEWGAKTPWPFFSSFPGELGAAVTKGRREEFAQHGWGDDVADPQDQATFDAAVLRWSELDVAAHRRLLDWYTTLIAWHRDELPAHPTVVCHWMEDDSGRPRWWAIERGPYLAMTCLSPESVVVGLGAVADRLAFHASWRCDPHIDDGSDEASVVLRPGESIVLNRTDDASQVRFTGPPWTLTVDGCAPQRIESVVDP